MRYHFTYRYTTCEILTLFFFQKLHSASHDSYQRRGLILQEFRRQEGQDDAAERHGAQTDGGRRVAEIGLTHRALDLVPDDLGTVRAGFSILEGGQEASSLYLLLLAGLICKYETLKTQQEKNAACDALKNHFKIYTGCPKCVGKGCLPPGDLGFDSNPHFCPQILKPVGQSDL